MTEKCRAKNPSICWKHGNQQGVQANENIKAALSAHSHNSVPDKNLFERPLKTMNAATIAATIAKFADELPGIDGVNVRSALLLAAELHKNDLRSNRQKYAITPYVEHPLRNTLRIIRWGCTDGDVIISSILHDTVEDHPHELNKLAGNPETDDEHEARRNAFAYLKKTFSLKVAAIVKGMSNPIFEDRYLPAAKKNAIYAQHVEEAIEDPAVCINKMADFTDNALGLFHNRSSMSTVSLRKKATKYLLVIDVLQSRIQKSVMVGDMPASLPGLKSMLRQIERGRPGLVELSQL